MLLILSPVIVSWLVFLSTKVVEIVLWIGTSIEMDAFREFEVAMALVNHLRWHLLFRPSTLSASGPFKVMQFSISNETGRETTTTTAHAFNRTELTQKALNDSQPLIPIDIRTPNMSMSCAQPRSHSIQTQSIPEKTNYTRFVSADRVPFNESKIKSNGSKAKRKKRIEIPN